MPGNTNTSDIGFAAIIFWDFVFESDDDELLKSLANLYGEKPEEYSGPYIGGGRWYHKVAGNETNEIEDSENFASVRTLVESNTMGVLDVTTFAVLSEEQIEHVLTSDDRSGLQDLQETISVYVEQIPTLNNHGQTGHKGVYYAEWDGEPSLIPDFGELDKTDIMDRLGEGNSPLFSFGFQIGGNLSLVEGNIFVSPTSVMDPYDGLAAIRKDLHPQSEPVDDLITPPPWYAEVSGLKRYYRLKVWADSRWRRLHEFDDQTDEARETFSTLSSTDTDVQEILSVSEQIQDLQAEFTEFRTRYDAEFQSLQDQFRKRADEQTSTFETPYDIALPRPEKPEYVDRSGDQTNSIIEYFEDSSEEAFEQVDSLYDRITEKTDSLVSSVASRTQLAATDENLALQNKISTLTQRLTFLTLILILLTVVLISVEFL